MAEPEWEVLPPEQQQRRKSLESLFKWLDILMDNLVPIPGIKRRLGLNPIIDLIPVVGDISAGLVSASVLLYALRSGLPKILLARMALNIGLNEVVGAVPVLGSAFAFWFKANHRNYALLHRHIDMPSAPRKGDWLFVVAIVGISLLIMLGGLAATFWFLHEFLKLLGIH